MDAPRRHDIERNHSATHLVHYALRKHLGTHVRQQGSLVQPERLRFDFSHHGPIDADTLHAIEQDVNEQVLANEPVVTREMAYPDALALGAMAFFSREVRRPGARGADGALDRALRRHPRPHDRPGRHLPLLRPERRGGRRAADRGASPGTGALRAVRELEQRLAQVAEALKAQPEHLVRRVEQLLEERQRLEARLAEALRSGGGGDIAGDTSDVNGVQVTIAETASDDRAEVGQIADRFREGKRNSVLVLFSTRRTGRDSRDPDRRPGGRGPQGRRPGQPDCGAERGQGRRASALRLGRRG